MIFSNLGCKIRVFGPLQLRLLKKQSSFTVKNPRVPLVKIDCFLWFNLWLENGQVFNKYMNQIKFFWAFIPAKVVIYQNIHSSNLASFLINVLKLLKVWSLGFSCSTLQCFCLFFLSDVLNGIQPFARFFLNTGFKITEIGLLYGGEHLEAKICRFLTFLTKWWCLLNRRRQRDKTFQILVEFF